MKKTITGILFLCFFAEASAQQVEHTGWLMFVNSTRLTKHWSTHLDVQLRSGDDLSYLRNVMLRPGATYNFNKNQNATVGYLYVHTNRNLDGTTNNTLIEHRVWEQFVQNHKLGPVLAAHRFRLEQRFIEQPAGNEVFAQRFRYFARFIAPLKKYEASFAKGPFLALQNEVFLHVQHKDKLNKSTFDQNRLYLAAGYRLSAKADLEAGYLNQSVNGLSVNTVNHVVQVGVYTRF